MTEFPEGSSDMWLFCNQEAFKSFFKFLIFLTHHHHPEGQKLISHPQKKRCTKSYDVIRSLEVVARSHLCASTQTNINTNARITIARIWSWKKKRKRRRVWSASIERLFISHNKFDSRQCVVVVVVLCLRFFTSSRDRTSFWVLVASTSVSIEQKKCIFIYFY